MTLPESHYDLDDVYLGTPEHERPKESFKQLVDLIRDAHGPGPLSLLDVGCATGAFLQHAGRRLELRDPVGVDLFEPLLEEARSRVPGCEFQAISLTDLEERVTRPFDVVTCLGTAVLFDDVEQVVRNLLSAVAPGGSCWIWDVMNEDPVDVVMRWRTAPAGDWTSGFNVFSVESYVAAARHVVPSVDATVQRFRMPFAIARGDDPMRAWTISTEEDEHQLVVGTGQLLRFHFLRLAVPGPDS